MTGQIIFAWIGTDGDRTIEFMLYAGIAILLVLASAVLSFLWWLLAKYVIHQNFSIIKTILVIVPIVLIGFFSIFILPGIIRESNWQSLQATCAEQVGYQSPDDNNNPQIATSNSQMRYRDCLGLYR